MRTLLIVAWLTTMSACVASKSLGKDLADGDGSGSGTEDGSGTGSDGDGDATGTGDGTGQDRIDMGEDTDGDACVAEPEDTACVACEKHNCCPAWEACRGDDRCICIVVCRAEGHTVDACITHCGIDHGEHADLLACADANCAEVCP